MEKKEREIKKERSGFWFVSRVNEMNDSVASWLDPAAARVLLAVTQGCSCVERGARCDAMWRIGAIRLITTSADARGELLGASLRNLYIDPLRCAAGNLILMRRK